MTSFSTRLQQLLSLRMCVLAQRSRRLINFIPGFSFSILHWGISIMGAGAIVTVNEQGGWKNLLNPDRRFYNNWRLICLNAWVFLFLITSSSNGFDGSMMNGLQSLEQWVEDFNRPTGGMLGLLNAIQNIGALGALPFAPYLSDGIGRRPSVLLGASILWGATLLQTFSSSVGMFIGSRFLVGFGTTIAANAAPMIISEIAYPSHRATLTSLYNCMWYSGSIAAAWTTFGCVKMQSSWAWRLPSLVQGIPSAAQVLLLWFAPESPRWLVCKNREDQALRTLAHYHADGNQQDPLVKYELEEIKHAIAADRDATDANVGWLSFLTVPGNRKRLRIFVALAFFSQWSGNGLVSYYLSEVFKTIGITDPTMQLLINGLLQIWNLFISVGAACLVDKLGRRFLFITSCSGMLVFFIMQTVCSATFAETGSESAAHAVIASIFLFYAAYDLAFTPLIVSYTIEILPFAIRAKGLTVFSLVVTISLIFNQYVNPVALQALGWKYYIVYCAWLAFELIYCFIFIVETKGMTLEETATLFDGKPAAGAQSVDPADAESGGSFVIVDALSEKAGRDSEVDSLEQADANASQASLAKSSVTLTPGEHVITSGNA